MTTRRPVMPRRCSRSTRALYAGKSSRRVGRPDTPPAVAAAPLTKATLAAGSRSAVGGGMQASVQQDDRGARRPGQIDPLFPGDRPLDEPRHIGLGGRYHFAAVQLHVIDRQVAEIADVPDFAGHAVAVGRRRLLGDHQLLRPQGDPHLAAQWLVAAGAGHDGAAGFRTLHDEMVALAPRDAAFQDVHLADEVGDVARVRILVELAGGRDLDDAAAVHHGDAARHRHRLLLVVGDDHEGDAGLFLDVHQLELGLRAQVLVERAERLVEQQHLRLLHQAARESDALALAAGKLVRLALGEGAELDHLDHLVDAPLDLRLWHAVLLQAEGDVLLDVHVREERIGLEHHVDRPLVGRHARHVPAFQQDLAPAGDFEAGQHAQQGGLAAPGGPEQGEELALVDVEGDVVDRDEVAELLRYADDLHVRLLVGIVPRRPALARRRAAAAGGAAQRSGFTHRMLPRLACRWRPLARKQTAPLSFRRRGRAPDYWPLFTLVQSRVTTR